MSNNTNTGNQTIHTIPNLKMLLSKLGESTLTKMLGKSTVELLHAFNLRTPSPAHLADILIERYTEIGILLNRDYRIKLFSALKQEEASNLCQVLGIKNPDPWNGLESLRITPKSKTLFELLDVFGIDYSDMNQDLNQSLVSASNNLEASYPLFPHQLTASRKAIKIITDEHGRVVLHMPTGSGKTRTAMNIICDLLRQKFPLNSIIVWLAYSEELCDQAAEEFETAWESLGYGTFPVHRHYGSTRVHDLASIERGFIVLSLGLAYQTCFSNDEAFFKLARNTKLVIMDEAHQAIAETYQHVLNILAPSNKVMLLGLTATPGRSFLDVDEDLRLAEFFARQKVTLEIENYENPINYLIDKGYLAKVVTEPINYEGEYARLAKRERANMAKGFDLSSGALKVISEDSLRNLLIVQRIIEEQEAGEKLIVFACSIQHADTLATILNLKGVHAISITGMTTPDIRRNSIEQFKNDSSLNVLINYGILTTGFDAPKATVAIIARPTKSLVLYSQMVGRVVRGPKAGGTQFCKVITVVDQLFGFRDLGESFEFWNDLWE